MAYDDDLRTLAKLEKLRVATLIFALVLLIASMMLELVWLDWLRAVAWASAGVVAVLEARLLRRLGRDPDLTYLWALAYFLLAGLCLL